MTWPPRQTWLSATGPCSGGSCGRKMSSRRRSPGSGENLQIFSYLNRLKLTHNIFRKTEQFKHQVKILRYVLPRQSCRRNWKLWTFFRIHIHFNADQDPRALHLEPDSRCKQLPIESKQICIFALPAQFLPVFRIRIQGSSNSGSGSRGLKKVKNVI